MENVKEQHQRELASLRASYEAEVQQVKRRFEAQEARLRSRQAEEPRLSQQSKWPKQPKYLALLLFGIKVFCRFTCLKNINLN